MLARSDAAVISTAPLTRHRIEVTGVVQGVGFRPHIARLAYACGLSGWVRNTGDGVRIEVQGDEASIGRFEIEFIAQAPPLARIEQTSVTTIDPVSAAGFTIENSESIAAGLAAVPPDTAPCEDCLCEMWDPNDRRYRHPFITCTNCGPRWTIVTELPYDRPHTTMAGFAFCSTCRAEYDDPNDRRHHAQPIGCHECGPRLQRRAGTTDTAPLLDADEIISATQTDLLSGRVVALKGVGGFHLVVDATNDRAVQRLRDRKHRPDKPFAVMVRDLDMAREIAYVSPEEEQVLTSPARPIVLLRARPSLRVRISDHVAPNSPVIGVMLPYSPLHHLLFAPVPGHHQSPPAALVMTSGNVADEPIIYRDADAIDKLQPLVDAFCLHDRPIVVPCDDSVVRIVDGHESPIRRSRGYAPLPITLPFSVPALLAIGGDLKNTCCVAAGNRALLSQHLGDMGSLATHRAAERAADSLAALHGITPTAVVVDRHPGYHSVALARALGLEVISVGHHHAHVAAVMAEHQVDPQTPVIGFSFDGTGWGDDQTLWGGEVLVGNYESMDRRVHLMPTRLPGGEAAIRQPWRMALAYLRAADVAADALAVADQADEHERRIVDYQIESGFNSPETSSMGRLFDAVASLLNVRHVISHEAQAAIELEALAVTAEPAGGITFELADGVIDPRPVIRSIVEQLRSGVDRAALAHGFHLAVADIMLVVAQHLRDHDATRTTIALSGGVFQNDLLTVAATARLRAEGFTVLTHRIVPTNDGGLALGQAAIAGYRLSRRLNQREDS